MRKKNKKIRKERQPILITIGERLDERRKKINKKRSTCKHEYNNPILSTFKRCKKCGEFYYI